MDIRSRLSKLEQRMTEKGIKAFLVSQPENRRYLSGFTGSDGYLLITPERRVLATDSRYTEQAGKEAEGYKIFPVSGELVNWFPQMVSEMDSREMGFEAGYISFALYQRITEALSKVPSPLQLVPTEGIVELLRKVKEPMEIELITKAVEITDRAFKHIANVIRPGMTEKAVAWEIEKFMREHGSEAVAFEVIVAAGASSAMPHARPGDNAISLGEPIVIDIGARFNSYCSDLTRTICLGAPNDIFRKVYDIVLKAQLTASAEIKEGMSGAEADESARRIIREAGYGDNFGHGMGHGMGLAIHEPPRLGPNSTEILTNGMVFSIEPGIYISGWGGVRIEDTVVLEKGKVRTLSRAPKTPSY